MSKPPFDGVRTQHEPPADASATVGADRFVLKLGLFYAAYFLFGGIQLPFFPLWLEARGLDPREIGLIIAVPMLMRIVATPIIAYQADRRDALKATLVIASTVGALAMATVGLVEGLLAILIAYAVAAAAFSPVLSLTDAYALNGLAARRRAYGPVRLWGSVAFIVGNVGAGLLLHRIAAVQLIWVIVAVLILVSVSAAALTSISGRAAATGPVRVSPRALWKSGAFLAAAAAISLVQPSHALYYGFSTVAWRGAGFDGVTIGLLWGLGVAAEIALFALSSRLPPALTPTVLIMIGAAGAAIRWTAMAFDPPLALLPWLQCLHAASFGATHLGGMAFLARAVPGHLAATAQGTIATASAIVSASATGLSGLLYASAGSLAYLLMAGMALAGLFCAFAADQLWRDRDRTQG